MLDYIMSGSVTAVSTIVRYHIPRTKEDWISLAVIAVVYIVMTLLLKAIGKSLSERSRNTISGAIAVIAGLIAYAVMK